MIFTFKVPQFVRRLRVFLFQNDGLIKSYRLVCVLYLRFHKLCCGKRRQALLKFKRNFTRIFIKNRLIIPIIDGKPTKRAELISSQTFRLNYISTVLCWLSCFLIFDTFSNSKTYLIKDYLAVLYFCLFHLFFDNICTLEITSWLSSINLRVIIRLLFSSAQ